MDDFLDQCEDGFQGEGDLHHIAHVDIDPKYQDADARPRDGMRCNGTRIIEVPRVKVDEKADKKKTKRCVCVLQVLRVLVLAEWMGMTTKPLIAVASGTRCDALLCSVRAKHAALWHTSTARDTTRRCRRAGWARGTRSNCACSRSAPCARGASRRSASSSLCSSSRSASSRACCGTSVRERITCSPRRTPLPSSSLSWCAACTIYVHLACSVACATRCRVHRRVHCYLFIAFICICARQARRDSSHRKQGYMLAGVQLFISFGQLFTALFVFPTELAMLLKERASDMYCLSAYYIARSTATIVLDLAYPSMFIFILYWLSGLRQEPGPFFANWLAVLLMAMVAQSIGLLLGAAFASVQKAQTAATVSMLTFILCSGFWIKSVPGWLVWVKCVLGFSTQCGCSDWASPRLDLLS
jgi:ABC-2 type transporter